MKKLTLGILGFVFAGAALAETADDDVCLMPNFRVIGKTYAAPNAPSFTGNVYLLRGQYGLEIEVREIQEEVRGEVNAILDLALAAHARVSLTVLRSAYSTTACNAVEHNTPADYLEIPTNDITNIVILRHR